MTEPHLGGKTVTQWLDLLDGGSADQRKRAINILRDMLLYSHVTQDRYISRITTGLSKATAHSHGATRTMAYGAVGFLTRWFVHDIRHATGRKKMIAEHYFRRIVQYSSELHLDVIKSAPDVIDAMLTRSIAASQVEYVEAIVQKLQDTSTKHSKRYADAANKSLAEIEAIKRRHAA